MNTPTCGFAAFLQKWVMLHELLVVDVSAATVRTISWQSCVYLLYGRGQKPAMLHYMYSGTYMYVCMYIGTRYPFFQSATNQRKLFTPIESRDLVIKRTLGQPCA